MDAKPVKIYSSEDVPRLRYIAGIILGDILGLSWEIVTDKRKLGSILLLIIQLKIYQDVLKYLLMHFYLKQVYGQGRYLLVNGMDSGVFSDKFSF